MGRKNKPKCVLNGAHFFIDLINRVIKEIAINNKSIGQDMRVMFSSIVKSSTV